MNYILDHHNENYNGIMSNYNGMDYNDYIFEKSLEKIENEK